MIAGDKESESKTSLPLMGWNSDFSYLDENMLYGTSIHLLEKKTFILNSRINLTIKIFYTEILNTAYILGKTILMSIGNTKQSMY